jgi:hypothetical protein
MLASSLGDKRRKETDCFLAVQAAGNSGELPDKATRTVMMM